MWGVISMMPEGYYIWNLKQLRPGDPLSTTEMVKAIIELSDRLDKLENEKEMPIL